MRFEAIASAGCTVKVPLVEVNEPWGVEVFAVSCTVTLRLFRVPADPPTPAASEQLPVFVLVAQENPVGKLFGVNV